MVKLTEEQKRQLEALDNIPDDEIDFSDIPLITDWSGFKMGRFYRPKWKDFSFKLDEEVIDLLGKRLADGQTLDESVNKALGALMYRIRFPFRVERAEEASRRIQESPEEAENLNDQQKDDIEAQCAMPIEEILSSGVSLNPVKRREDESAPFDRPKKLSQDRPSAAKHDTLPLNSLDSRENGNVELDAHAGFRTVFKRRDITLRLDENLIDWFEARLEAGRTLDEDAVKWFEERLVEGQTLDETINMALWDHIRYISFPERVS